MGKIFDSRQTAELLGISPATLRTWRARNMGPASFKIGRKLAYYESDLNSWIDQQRKATTRGDNQ